MNYTDIFNARGHSYNLAHAVCPSARHPERQLLLNLLKLKPQDIVLDVPAGGGFVAEALQEHVLKTICIEPSPEFARSIPPGLQTHSTPIYKTGLPACFATKYASLAGLHHLKLPELADLVGGHVLPVNPIIDRVLADTQVLSNFLYG